MRTTNRRTLGWSLIVLGVSSVVFSQKIVFPGLETLFGIEAIVGQENTVYEADGSYMFTNPSAMIWWVASVVVFGLTLVCGGSWLLFTGRRRGST